MKGTWVLQLCFYTPYVFFICYIFELCPHSTHVLWTEDFSTMHKINGIVHHNMTWVWFPSRVFVSMKVIWWHTGNGILLYYPIEHGRDYMSKIIKAWLSSFLNFTLLRVSEIWILVRFLTFLFSIVSDWLYVSKIREPSSCVGSY